MRRTLALLSAAALALSASAAVAHVTSVTISPSSLSGPAACPLQQIFIGQITSTEAGQVGFQWTTSDGQHTELQQAVFDSAGTRPVSYLWLAPTSGPTFKGWIKLETHTPNRKVVVAQVSVTCK